jgi:hypothetical protein
MRWCDRPYKKKWFKSEPSEAAFGDILSMYTEGMASKAEIIHFEEGCIKPEYLAKAREVRARAEKKMLAKRPAAEVPLTPSSMASAPYRTEHPRPAFAAKQ